MHYRTIFDIFMPLDKYLLLNGINLLNLKMLLPGKERAGSDVKLVTIICYLYKCWDIYQAVFKRREGGFVIT
ncbi:hypothetical protein MAR_019479 [Mya arenaria]|uniref:Uncharacterized protein n=1 Tax=Mya arenaria TaxID=6604 RepID=A0ABY7E2P4_MYAAR|nr:hypothetical protein MAR_019479 [Mya arenaria]